MANMTFKANLLPDNNAQQRELGSSTSTEQWKLNGAMGAPVEYIVGSQTAATGSWTGTTRDSSLITGKVIAYKLPQNGSGDASLTLTFTNPPSGSSANSGAIPVYLNTTRVTTHYAAGAVILMVYDGSNWRTTDYWNSNSRDAGYGKISLTQSSGTSALTTNTTQLQAATYNEAMTLAAGNKWVQFAGTNGTSGNDVLTVAHSLSGVTANSYGDSSNQTPTYGGTFNVPYITVDAAGHITAISTHTVKIPASDNTNNAVTQTNQTGANDYRILLSGTADDTTRTEGSNKSTNLRFNPSTKVFSVGGSISATGDLNLTGDANFNGETYADSATIGSLLVNGAANFVQIPTSPTPATSSNDTSIATTAFVKNNLGGLSGAMHFKGTTTTTMSDGLTTAAVTIGGSSYTPSAGDVVLYSDSEFVWTGSAWERLGRDSSFKTTQSAVTTATAETTTATTFVYSVTQDANGVITVKTRPLPTYNNYSLPTASTSTKGGIKVGSGLTMSSETLNHSNSVTAKTAYVDTATTASANGGTIKVTDIKYDAQGHITGSQDRTITLSQTTYSLSGLGGVGTVSASGTAPLTLSASKSGTTVTISGSVAAATTSAAGVMAMSATNLNTMINQLSTGSSDPVDGDYYISQYVNGGTSTTTYHRRPMSNLYNYIKTKLAVTNNTINLSRNTETTIATIGGTAIKIKLPASDNTDTKQNITLATTSKAFITGVTTTPTSSAQALTGVADTGVYLTATAGELSAVRHSFNSNGTEKAYITFNTTTNALDFIFA